MMATACRLLDSGVAKAYPFLAELGIEDMNFGCFDGECWKSSGEIINPITPITGKSIGPKVQLASCTDTMRCIANINKAKKTWASYPAPKRGEIVREIGYEMRKKLKPLGQLLSLEVGKIISEGIGEIQEYIDICDLSTGLSRQIPGQIFPSERPEHFMMEQWHPLGAIGIICAFNFPVAIAGWNAAVSMIAGNTHIWKSSLTTTLCSIATQKIVVDVLKRNNISCVSSFVAGGKDIGELIVDSPSIPLVSFTGSCDAGRIVNQKLASRFAKSILELGGNNAIFVMDDADLKIAISGILFAAVGTSGQRCTTCRRLYIHESKYDEVIKQLITLYKNLKIGNPLDEKNLIGPLHSSYSVKQFLHTIDEAIDEGGKVLVGGKVLKENSTEILGPNYVQPTIIEIDSFALIVQKEVFAPILYVMKFKTIDEAISLNNSVEQGLSSSMFTNNIRNQYLFLGPNGADTGIANINISTNGAEIGGAFGGEKSTGGGRESGSDSWKQYMRRQTNTINYGTTLPLAQGINFNI